MTSSLHLRLQLPAATARAVPLTSSLRAARGPCRRHGAARQPPPEGPRRPRRHPLRARGLHQPAVLPHRGCQQPARPRREVPGAARLPRPAAQRARREGGGAQPGAAALLAGLRRAALPARREAPGAGGVPAAPPHDGDRRREAAPAATARAAARGCPCGRLGRARQRHRALTRPGREGPSGPGLLRIRDCTGPGAAPARYCSGSRTAPDPGLLRPGTAPDPGLHRARHCSGPADSPALSVHLTPLKCYLCTLHRPSAAFSGLLSVRVPAARVLQSRGFAAPMQEEVPGALPAAVAHLCPLPSASSSCQSFASWL